MPDKKLDQFKEHAQSYNKATKEFIENADVEGKAREARKAIEGAEGKRLKEAEKSGLSHAAETDPQISRDYANKGSRPDRS